MFYKELAHEEQLLWHNRKSDTKIQAIEQWGKALGLHVADLGLKSSISWFSKQTSDF